MTSGANFIDDPRKWRVSKSGFSIRTGWNEDKTIIARYPGAPSPLDNEHFQKWLDAAFAICDLYNSLLLTDLQRAVIEHDDDMARLDRNTLTPASPAALRDEAYKRSVTAAASGIINALNITIADKSVHDLITLRKNIAAIILKRCFSTEGEDTK